MSDTNPKDPKDPNDPAPNLNTPWNLLKVAIAVVIYSMVQCSYSQFNALVDWSKSPDSSTIHTVIESLKPSLTLGAIRGGMLAVMAVIIVWLGPPLWAIVGPVLAAAMRGTLRYIAALSRAIRAITNEKDGDGHKDAGGKGSPTKS
jgi:hypothetical protein